MKIISSDLYTRKDDLKGLYLPWKISQNITFFDLICFKVFYKKSELIKSFSTVIQVKLGSLNSINLNI